MHDQEQTNKINVKHRRIIFRINSFTIKKLSIVTLKIIVTVSC